MNSRFVFSMNLLHFLTQNSGLKNTIDHITDGVSARGTVILLILESSVEGLRSSISLQMAGIQKNY